ncbi:MAG: hypothetical protein KC912_15120 [Proteobacteria bacterium]|nr:hypothetical protein [Pseudomonadota bacterium]
MIALLTLSALASPSSELTGLATSQWRSEDSPEEMQKVLDDAVERVAQAYPFFARGLVRSKLRESATYCPDITIAATAEAWTSQCADGGPFSRAWGGGEQPFTTAKGRTVRSALAYDPSSVTIEFKGEDGSRINTYRFEATRMVLDVAITSDRLTVPFVWQFSYMKDEASVPSGEKEP